MKRELCDVIGKCQMPETKSLLNQHSDDDIQSLPPSATIACPK
jgi:hypothetical protein